jgi:peptidoglycan/LPS O-acetylase OafA/YrhL
LWSIANEFWYYLLFPLFLSVFIIRGWVKKTVSLLLIITTLLLLPNLMIFQGVAWLLGAGIFFAQQWKKVNEVCRSPLFLFGGILFPLIVLVMIRFNILWIFFDYLIPFSFVPLIAACSVRGAPQGIYSRYSAAASEVSYTIYLVHFPIMAFLFFSFLQGRQMVPGFLTCGLFCIILIGIILYSFAIWWLFERNTDRIRKFVSSRLLPLQ